MPEPFQVLYEDNHLIAVSKAAGVLVQGDSTGDVPLSELLKRYIKEKYSKPGAVFLGVVHRLDRPVTGVVVMARTSKALSRMNELFREKETEKVYYALVTRQPREPEGRLVHWLLKDESKNRTTAYQRETPGALRSELTYRLLSSSGGTFLLEVKPLTGRPHQIRVQLANLGCPIRGDVKYGAGTANDDGSICLHARSLRFLHPVKKEMIFIEAELPETEMWSYFKTV